MTNNTLANIGNFCRNYRLNTLELTLREIEGNDNIKTLSSFENGRSSNIHHLLKYVSKCETKEQKIDFIKGLITTLEGE